MHDLTKQELLKPLAAIRTNEVVVTTMGMVRPWARLSGDVLDFASADSAMGHAADLALGIALARPDRRVICLNGDGSMLMSLGTLVTVVQSGVQNLILFVVQNDTYEITGNQPVPGAGRLDFSALARGAGFQHVYSFDDPAIYARRLPEVIGDAGPVFVAVKVAAGEEAPLQRGERVSEPYLQPSLAESAHHLKAALARSIPLGSGTPAT